MAIFFNYNGKVRVSVMVCSNYDVSLIKLATECSDRQILKKLQSFLY